jgi:hypothetical protein
MLDWGIVSPALKTCVIVLTSREKLRLNKIRNLHLITRTQGNKTKQASYGVCLNVLPDCARRVRSPDRCDADGPHLIERPLFHGSARRAGRLFLFRDVMTGRTWFLGELHLRSLMTLAVGYGRGESCEVPRVVMDAEIEHQDFTVLALYFVPQFVVCEARAIAEGWSGHGSPPTLKRWNR